MITGFSWGHAIGSVSALSAISLLAIAALLDFVIGDPWHWPHPVQGLGLWIATYTQWVTRPAVMQPTVPQPAVTQPAVTQPVVIQPVVTQPAKRDDFSALNNPSTLDNPPTLSDRSALDDRSDSSDANQQRPDRQARFSPITMRGLGVALMVLTLGGAGIVAGGSVTIATKLHPGLGWAIAVIWVAAGWAGRSLRDAAQDVLEPIQTAEWDTARSHLSRYVGRDTAHLSPTEILRAVLETVAENAVDGVFAPLLWAIAIAVVVPNPAAIAANVWIYKAASTLDSMVGYRRAPYTDLGWASARLEDGLTWIPCRITVGAIALLSGRPRSVITTCRRDAPQDPSPNSGWSECAYAAALGIQLGGDNFYQGELKRKPLLGNAQHPLSVEAVQAALALNRRCFLGFLGLGSGAIVLIHGI